jgi:hypothetical protein
MKMKRSIILILALVLFLYAGPYEFQSNLIFGPSPEPPIGLSDVYLNGVAVSGNGDIWTSVNSSDPQYRMLFVYHPLTGLIDTLGPGITSPSGPDTLGTARGLVKLKDGNIAFADWTNEKIRIFDRNDHSIVKESDTGINCGGGIETFVYNNNQYYLSQEILGTTVILWDDDFNVLDTLVGGAGGRNLACTMNGDVILSPSLSSDFFIEWRGNPDDGYVTDTIDLADLDIQIDGVSYISTGPNQWVWLMSRDKANDGVLVVDPHTDYDVIFSSTTDTSITNLNEINLGMVVDDLVQYWLQNGIIDSSGYLATYQPQMLIAPSDIAYDWDGGSLEHLYLIDRSANSLKLFTRTLSNVNINPLTADKFVLGQAYPNPFNPMTTIPCSVYESGQISLKIFDVSGKLVSTLVDDFLMAGNYDFKWNAGDCSSGLYIYRLEYGDERVSRKLLLMK